MKTVLLILKLLSISLFLSVISCSKSDDGSEDDAGSIPTTLSGKTISMSYSYDIYSNQMDATPVSGTNCDLTGMTKGASKYIYSKLSEKEAALTLTGKQILATNTYTYFWEMTLTFTDSKSGYLKGTYMAKTGFVTPITGTFQIE